MRNLSENNVTRKRLSKALFHCNGAQTNWSVVHEPSRLRIKLSEINFECVAEREKVGKKGRKRDREKERGSKQHEMKENEEKRIKTNKEKEKLIF